MILQIEGVDKKFGGLLALDHVDLNVEEGEIVGVIGPNGAGKSTLLNVIAGVYRPTVGSVRFRGKKISGLNSREDLPVRDRPYFPNPAAILKNDRF